MTQLGRALLSRSHGLSPECTHWEKNGLWLPQPSQPWHVHPGSGAPKPTQSKKAIVKSLASSLYFWKKLYKQKFAINPSCHGDVMSGIGFQVRGPTDSPDSVGIVPLKLQLSYTVNCKPLQRMYSACAHQLNWNKGPQERVAGSSPA